MQQIGAAVHHGFDGAEFLAAAAFHHIARQRERAAGKADERHAAVQGFADGRHGVEYIAQILHVRHAQGGDIGFSLYGFLEFRAFAGFKIQPQAHGVRNGQNIGKQDGGVQIVAVDGLEGYFGGQFGVFAQIHKAAGAGAGFAVFGQVAAGLAHHPNGRVFNGLAQKCAQKGVVFQWWHDGVFRVIKRGDYSRCPVQAACKSWRSRRWAAASCSCGAWTMNTSSARSMSVLILAYCR